MIDFTGVVLYNAIRFTDKRYAIILNHLRGWDGKPRGSHRDSRDAELSPYSASRLFFAPGRRKHAPDPIFSERKTNMKRYRMKAVMGAIIGAMGVAGIAAAADVAVGVDVTTPNVRVRVGAPAPPPPPPMVMVERERIVTGEREERHDHGKHKGHYKKHDKDKHHKD
jgi:hypothetical protein